MQESSETVFTINDSQQFRETLDALKVLTFSSKRQEEIFNIAAAVLHMGNLTFNRDHGDSSRATVSNDDTVGTAAGVGLSESKHMV